MMQAFRDRLCGSSVPPAVAGAMLIALLGSLAGCGQLGPVLAPVRGQVTMDDKPLVDATVEFSPDGEGSTSIGITDENGNYDLGYTRDKKGAMIGWHTVDIYFDPDVVRSRVRIPERYNTRTELREEVVDDDNVIDFKLTSSD